jgi:hypothetical protein
MTSRLWAAGPGGTTAEWAPTKVELTTDSWIDAKTRGETMGGVSKVDTGAIESAFIAYNESKERLAKAKSKSGKTARTKALIKRLETLQKALQKYFPKDAKRGGRVDEMWK